MVRKRRKRYPKMHIYHYAAYEKTALLRLAGRYGEGEDEVDDLLRNGVLVDLYPFVRKSIRVGTENYSLNRSSRSTWGTNCVPETSPPRPTRSPCTPATANCCRPGQ